MIFVVVLIAGVSAAATLAFFAMGENVLYFFSPSQLSSEAIPTNRQIRVGGLVVDGSVVRDNESLRIAFDLTDSLESVTVTYDGILPDLFREGQGIIAIGQLEETGIFSASEVLAKHDENYMPPEVSDAINQAKAKGVKLKAPHEQKNDS